MKRFKIISIIIIILLAILLLTATCKKTKALESELFHQTINISSRSQSDYGVVFIASVGNNRTGGSSDFMMIYAGNTILNLLNISNQNINYLSVQTGAGVAVESYQLQSRILQIEFVEDQVLSMIFMRIYELSFTLQQTPGLEPAISGITRNLLTSFGLGIMAYDYWESPDGLTIAIGWPQGQGNPNWNSSLLLNYSYISYLETSQDVNDWVDYQVGNFLEYNNLIKNSYDLGYTDGDNAGYSRGYNYGDQQGYSRGYDYGHDIGYYEGLQDGYDLGEQSTDAYQSGYDDGYLDGEQTQTAYQDGWADGQAGNTAITPVFNTISGVFGAIGSILAIELVPHIPLGLLILVPLFFAVLGLILWIWRRN